MKLDSYVSGFLLVTASGGLSILGLLTVRRMLRSKDLISCHDVGGYLLSVVGTMYAVILGLIVVDSMSKFQQARTTTEQESNALADLILLSNQLPGPKRAEIQTARPGYVSRVVNDEWPMLDRGEHSLEARRSAVLLIDAVCQFDPRPSARRPSTRPSSPRPASSGTAGASGRHRQARRAGPGVVRPARRRVVTVAFTYFFKMEHLKIQLIMTAMVSTIIALNLFLVLMFGYPFSGDVKIGPDCFNVAQSIIEHPPGRPRSGPGAP